MDQRVVIGRVAAPLLVSTVLVATPLQAQITPSQSLQQRLQEDQLRLHLLELESDQRDDAQPLIRNAPDVSTPEHGRFQIKSLKLIGDLNGMAELEQQLQHWIGQSIQAEDLQRIQEAIAVWFWRRDQAVGTTIELDPGLPGGLTIRLALLELSAVEVDEALPHQLNKRLAIGTVTAAVPLGTPIHPGKLESALLKLNDLWGVQVRGRLQPGPTATSRSLVLEITNGDRNAAVLEVDNYLNPYVGSLRTLVTLSSANNLGLGERIWLNPSWWGSSEGTGTAPLQLGVDWPIGVDGLLLSASANAGRYQLFNTGTIDYTGETAGISLSLTQPLWRRDERSLWLRISGEGVHFRDERNQINLDDKRGAVLRASLVASSSDQWLGQGFNTLALGGSFGTINLDGNSSFKRLDRLTSRLQGNYGALNINFVREHVLSSAWSARWLLLGQWAANNLSGYEQCGLGWPNGVRAYPPGENSSSSCVVSQMDLHWRPRPWLKLVAFADVGWGERWPDPFPGSLQPNSYGLAGAGFGMDLGRVGQGLLSLRAAFPIGGNPASGSFIDLEASAPSPRLWAGVQLWL